jgi:hypothetical protein
VPARGMSSGCSGFKLIQCTIMSRNRTLREPSVTQETWYHRPWDSPMILRKDCKCPCHRAGHAIIHVVPCCGRNGPGSASMPRKALRKPKKDKIITLFANQKAE